MSKRPIDCLSCRDTGAIKDEGLTLPCIDCYRGASAVFNIKGVSEKTGQQMYEDKKKPLPRAWRHYARWMTKAAAS